MKEGKQQLHADQRYIEGILSDDDKILREIFKEFYPPIKKYILKNNGSTSDAQDLFKEALKIIYLQSKDGLT